ncbi:gamma-glutamyltransferase [uncultured Pseudokineococcus sp.]|uniref:gamma-glutamyltransferase n=1 Tax=uncultured Pseudokineococcus sp. TaxID=1642928 RepID=UPI002633E095|nr:gamma-glutamyltransferase [uncultured Pseudokineococcus sp.]
MDRTSSAAAPTARRGRPRRSALAVGLAGALVAGLVGAAPASAERPGGRGGAPLPLPPRAPVATGTGGAVSSVDPYATQIGLDVLADGGTAVDAAVATAAALGVTEPYSAGIGGGGFLVHYDAETGDVTAYDSRETAPTTFTEDVFRGDDGAPLPFRDVVSSGLSVGVPGTAALWERLAETEGTRPLAELLAPARDLARRGFVVDETFSEQTAANAERFSLFPATAQVFLPGGAVPEPGDVFRNPGLARAYDEISRRGTHTLYDGRMGRAVVRAARYPRTAPGVEVFPGQITAADLAAYEVLEPEPVRSDYRGLEVVGMPVPSSGGTTVAEALNLLEAYDDLTGEQLAVVPEDAYLHRFAEATATAFADRNRYVGDVPGVPVEELVSQGFADERACGLFDPDVAAARPIPFGSPDGDYATCDAAAGVQEAPRDDHGTTHLTVADASGDVVAYTLTIEQTGGSGITVPGYGFLLNNELTDFSFAPTTPGVPDPNLPGPGKRPRSSMAPTVVLQDGVAVGGLGSPGGSTIITTVAQVLTGYVDRGLPLVDAIAAPRVSSRNGATTTVEPVVADGPLGEALRARGHALSTSSEIGAATAVRVLPGGRFEAAAETVRRGGGDAGVVAPG